MKVDSEVKMIKSLVRQHKKWKEKLMRNDCKNERDCKPDKIIRNKEQRIPK